MDLLERLPCRHCSGQGTCKTGIGGASCAVCVRGDIPFLHRLLGRGRPLDFGNVVYTGLVCSVCHGRGTLEPTTFKFHNRMAPVLALIFIIFGGSLLVKFRGHQSFDAVLTFVGTLIGSVTGYYFGGQRAAQALFNEPLPPAPSNTSTDLTQAGGVEDDASSSGDSTKPLRA